MSSPRSVVEVRLPLEIARLIRKVFLPANLNKCRTYHPETRAAVQRYLDALETAEQEQEVANVIASGKPLL